MELGPTMTKALAAGLLVGAAGLAAAAPVLSEFRFDGRCADCAEAAGVEVFPVSAWLTLQDLPASGLADRANFHSFRYEGSNLLEPFSVTLASGGGDLIFDPANEDHGFSADFGVLLPGFAEVAMALIDGDAFAFANSALDGQWQIFRTTLDVAADFGDGGTWSRVSVVPAPPSLALVLAGLLLLRTGRRKRPAHAG